jgi:peptidylprolyl isomerase
VGFSGGFPAARDPGAGQAWLAHCYGMVGAGRGNEADSGNGSELYVVTGHAPRQLDRNIALVGRVVQGMELLSVLPRGAGPMGFYEQPSQHVPIMSVRVAADLPEAERVPLEVLRTDTATFAALVEARRNRRDDWYKVPAGYIDLCNVPLPARTRQ